MDWTTRQSWTGLTLVSLAVLGAQVGAVRAAALPELPRVYIDTTYAAPTGNIITVNAVGNLQTALNNAQLGDTIVLQAGATFTGPFTLPNKTTGSGWIYIRSSNYSSLPGPGRRVSPADAANMPKIVVNAGMGGAIRTATSAHHYRFVGIEVAPVSGQSPTYLITVGDADNPATTTSALPHDVTFDRCYIHGDPTAGGRRGIAMDGIRVAAVDCYVSDFKQEGSDTQALWVYNSPGPIRIHNNYLEAAGENFMIGGADPAITNLIPSDIEITHNYFFKPLSWMGTAWTVKNLLEFKIGQRILVEGNVFENNWAMAQVGYALLITPKYGSATTCVTDDITVRLNTFVNIGSGINISAYMADYNDPILRTSRISIQNNVLNITGLGGAAGKVFQLTGGLVDTTIDHNTALISDGVSPTLGSVDNDWLWGEPQLEPPANGFLFANNLMSHGDYGFKGSGKSEGNGTLAFYFTNWSFAANAIIGGDQADYPASNFFPVSIPAVGFTDVAGGKYALTSYSPYKNRGTDGKDLGADIGALDEATIGCVNGRWATPRGTPYRWMVQYGWKTNQDAIDEMDTDGDGMRTWQEYVAGTCPTNANSRFQCSVFGVQEGAFGLSWQSVTGRLYTVRYCDNLLAGGWGALAPSNVPGTGGQLTITDTNWPAIRFYQPGVKLP